MWIAHTQGFGGGGPSGAERAEAKQDRMKIPIWPLMAMLKNVIVIAGKTTQQWKANHYDTEGTSAHSLHLSSINEQSPARLRPRPPALQDGCAP